MGKYAEAGSPTSSVDRDLLPVSKRSSNARPPTVEIRGNFSGVTVPQKSSRTHEQELSSCVPAWDTLSSEATLAHMSRHVDNDREIAPTEVVGGSSVDCTCEKARLVLW
ncbi:hypothetical protein FH972_024101 [Carpinus fangiana]|uniref:Uncharacterized protein n=1 Tax=Carpinus fangiana TaxID=176857 RepID=A0A5N6KXR4_9ROSI|nr:hypothetical protein FH972_024101 [Carpinus fangiana]